MVTAPPSEATKTCLMRDKTAYAKIAASPRFTAPAKSVGSELNIIKTHRHPTAWNKLCGRRSMCIPPLRDVIRRYMGSDCPQINREKGKWSPLDVSNSPRVWKGK
ncbi:hypothetical protein JTB14_029462 [Gonioctena quinquepunctata]|nr:hypothetical protein JTB14_029462 [Gonioctena quinquepunctata]